MPTKHLANSCNHYLSTKAIAGDLKLYIFQSHEVKKKYLKRKIEGNPEAKQLSTIKEM